MAQYDAASNYAATWRKELGEGRTAIEALLTRMRAWLPLLVRDVPGFDASSYADRPGVPDDVIEDGERLLDFVAGEAKVHNLQYGELLISALTPVLQSAVKEWHEAEAADVHYQHLLRTTRASAAALDEELKHLRRTLAEVLGRSDKDYQKLRVARASQGDTDDDPSAPPAPPEVTPAEPGQPPPAVG